MSGGEQAALAVARALINEPSVILVDEPSAGLAPLVVHDVFETLRAVAETGVTMVLVEQNVSAALRLVDTVTLLQTGAVAWSGPVKQLDRSMLADPTGHRPPPRHAPQEANWFAYRAKNDVNADQFGEEEGRTRKEEGSGEESCPTKEGDMKFDTISVPVTAGSSTSARTWASRARPSPFSSTASPPTT